MRLNLHIYPSPFKNESRILRETRSIIKLDLADVVLIAASWEKGLKTKEYITNRIEIHRLKSVFNRFRKGGVGDILRFLAFMLQVIFKFRGTLKPQIINCHSLSVLFVGVFFKTFYKAHLIYDAHELETERSGVSGYRKAIARFLERSLISKSDKVVVVCDKIAEWYLEHYPFLAGKITVIRNIPEIAETDPDNKVDLKREFDIPQNSLLFVYQGGFVKGRGIDIMLKVFSETPNKHLVFIGYGPYNNLITEYTRKYRNIHVKSAVPPSELIAYTKTADCGISLIENISLSYYYSLPNKVFEYAMADVPLIVSNFPEMSAFVNSYGIGWAVPPEENKLKEIISTVDHEGLSRIKPSFNQVHREISWQIEENKLIGVYAFES